MFVFDFLWRKQRWITSGFTVNILSFPLFIHTIVFIPGPFEFQQVVFKHFPQVWEKTVFPLLSSFWAFAISTEVLHTL